MKNFLENSAEASKDILVETEKFVTGLLIPLDYISICNSHSYLCSSMFL